MKKKIMTLLLAMCMVVTLMPQVAFATREDGTENVTYVMEVDFDGEGVTLPTKYTDFVTGWNEAVGNQNTTSTTVKLLSDWTADDNGYFSATTGAGFDQGSGTANEYTGSMIVPENKSVVLDLNGYTINRNLNEEKYNGYVIIVDGTLTLKDSSSEGNGKIIGGFDSDVGGISVYGGNFTMEGGIISDNKGAGVYVLRGGTFNMKGGTITDNSEYGVYVNYDATSVSLSGSPVITGNYDNGENGNLFIESQKVINIEQGGLTEAADIGVTMSQWPVGENFITVATGTGVDGNSYKYFHSDKVGYNITNGENNEVKISKAPTYDVTFDSQGGSTVENQNIVDGNSVSAPLAPTRDGYTFGGWYTSADCTTAWNFSTPINESITLYAKWTKNSTGGDNGNSGYIPPAIDWSVYNVEKKIDAIGTVDLDKADEIKDARDAYNNLKEYQQKKVDNW